ncbi:MAG: hypothetical protein IKP92_01190 [Lachnospiraceae bacterium]|nr:hypothetical protein [Lachnospiraceae bacterium]
MNNLKKSSSLQTVAWRIIQVSLVVLTILGIVKSVFVSLDIDESYAIAQAYRLVTGDKLIFDMWEPHQFSAFLPALFLLSFYKLSGGMEYSVIFLRIAGILLHALAGAYLYLVAKKEAGKSAAFLLLILHLNFLPKWVSMPEFELIHYWCMLLIFLLLLSFEQDGKAYRPVLAGVLYVISGMCYPTMVILFPVYFLGLLLSKRKYGAALFAVSAAVPSALFLLGCFSFTGGDRFTRYISYILSDPSHASAGGAAKWANFASEFGTIGINNGTALAVAILFTAVILTGRGIINKRRKAVSAGKKQIAVNILIMLLAGCSFFLCIRTVWGYLLGDENQFTVMSRYIPMAVLCFVLALLTYKKNRAKFWYGILPGILSFPAALLLSNMGVNIACTKLFFAVISGVFVLQNAGTYGLDKDAQDKDEPERHAVTEGGIFAQLALAGFLVCFFLCRILLIRVTGCLPVTIKTPVVRVENGPAAGVLVAEKPGLDWNDSYRELSTLIPRDANVLYVGREQLFYACFCNRTMTPSVQGTTVYDELYDTYYREFPEKTPQIVVFDESLYDNPVYANYVGNGDIKGDHIKEWVSKNFVVKETRDVGIYRIVYLDGKR